MENSMILLDYETLRVIWWLLMGVLLIGFAVIGASTAGAIGGEHIHDEGIDESYLPVPMREDEGWERALAAVIEVEHALLDCVYR